MELKRIDQIHQKVGMWIQWCEPEKAPFYVDFLVNDIYKSKGISINSDKLSRELERVTNILKKNPALTKLVTHKANFCICEVKSGNSFVKNRSVMNLINTY